MVLPRTVLRPLGGYEQYSSSRHSLGLYVNVITVCRYAFPSPALSEKQVKASIQKALTTVVLEKLPALRVGISGEDTKKPVFVTLPSLDLHDHIEWVPRKAGLSSDEYDALLMRQLELENARPWLDVETHSPWRLCVYLNMADGWADLAFASHHALGDGKSGLIFHTLMVELLNSQEAARPAGSAEDESVLQFTEVPVLVPPQEELIKFTLSWPFFARTIWRELGPAWLKSAPKAGAYTGTRVTLMPKLGGYLRVFHLAPEHAAALLAGCRAHGTTLTALLHGLMMVLFARRFPADVASSFSCLMPIAMRPFVQAPTSGPALDVNRNMANLVSAHAYTYEADAVAHGRAVAAIDADDDEKVWRATESVSASLKARVANITADNILGLMGWISDWHKWWNDHEGKLRDGTWAISNTGSISATGELPPGAPPKWKLTHNFYTQSSMGKDSLINLNVGGIRGGEMSFIVAWHHGVVSDEFADGVTTDFHTCLVHYSETGHFAVPSRPSK